MRKRIISSRQKFRDYKDRLRGGSRTTDNGSRGSFGGPPRHRHRRLRSSAELIRAFFVLLRGQRSQVAFALLTLTVSSLLALVPPAATKFIIDNVLGRKPLPAEIASRLDLPTDPSRLLLLITAVVTLVTFVKIGIQIWGRWYATRATKLMQMSVRKKVFEHAVRLPLHQVQEIKSGGVASILREDGGSVGDLIFGMLYNPWRAVVQFTGSLCILIWVDWQLLIGGAILGPLVYVTHRTWINRIRPRFRDIRKRRQEIDARATEAFGGIRVIRAFSRQHGETSRFMKDNHLMGRQELFVWWWSRIIEIIWDALIPLASAGLLLYGGWQVLQNQLTVGDLMMFLVYLLMLLGPLAVLAQSAAQFQNGLSGLDRILDLLDVPREMQPSADSVTVRKENGDGRITLENVSFQYPAAQKFALSNISLNAEPGHVVALVGPSGAGKTTLCNLVARFYDPTSGRVLLDGRDVRDIEVESYRNLLGLVEQDVFLFDGSIAENIGYADRWATDRAIREAADIANATEFIDELPAGFNSLIGERGVKLSGGQRQRIAIARAVLANPRILVLDEATSNLDTESERLIQSSLATLMRNRTSFIIAHRLSTIIHADVIVVLDRGEILEMGTHHELMADGGKYQSMLQLQTGLGDKTTAVGLE